MASMWAWINTSLECQSNSLIVQNKYQLYTYVSLSINIQFNISHSHEHEHSNWNVSTVYV